MTKKISLITGANSGIGKAAAMQLVQKGHHTILACRNQEKGQQALNEIKKETGRSNLELMIVDMSLQSSIREMAQRFQNKHEHLDVLIHNAAIFDISQKSPLETGEGIESIWATNHLGPVLLTKLLLNPLRNTKDGRVLTITSKGLIAKPFLKVSLEDPEFKTRRFSVEKAYYQSKLAQIMYTYWLANQSKDTGIGVNSIYVTSVQIDINKYPEVPDFLKKIYALKSRFSISAEDMAQTYTHLATSPEMDGITGKVFDEKNRTVNTSRYSKDVQNINKVMTKTFSYLE